ncbi:Putative LOC100870303, partial [Caligus rogercresseyi]
NFKAEESADGKGVSGSYQVALPDGRIQTVRYTVDGYNGFVADVQYEGTPVYPKYEPKESSYKVSPNSYRTPPPYNISPLPSSVPKYSSPKYNKNPPPKFKSNAN